MNRIARCPSYLVHTNFGFCFRIVVPRDIQPLVGKTELRYSLKTGSLQAAKHKARFLAGHVQLYFQRVRQQGVGMGALTETQIQALITDYIQHSVGSWHTPLRPEDFDLKKDGLPPYQNTEELQDYIATLELVRQDLVVEMNLGQCGILEDSVLQLLQRNHIQHISPGSPEFRRLCYYVIKAEIQLLPIQQRHMQGDFSYQEELSKVLQTMFPNLRELPLPPPAQAQVQETLSYVAEKYWLEKEITWKRRTITEYRKCQDELLNFFGKDTAITAVDYPMARQYKDYLLSKTFQKGRALSGGRVNLYLGFAEALFGFAVRNHFVKFNPFADLQITQKGRRVDEIRDVFDVNDLEKLFVTSREYGDDTHLHPHTFWVPLLGLFTGCRLEEICQLYVQDIKQIDKKWVLDINEDMPDKSVKTNENRKVPLHPFLADDLKFIKFVKSVSNPKGRVFPELKRINNRYGHSVSQWFSRFCKRCGVKTEKKTFHSFRHTVANHLKQKGVAESFIAELLGHKLGTMTMGRYGKRYDVETLRTETVLKLDFGIDFTHLKKSKYVLN